MGHDAGLVHAIASGKAGATTQAQSAFPPPFASIETSSEKVRQGSVLMVQVITTAQAQVTGEFAGVSVPFYLDDSEGKQALVGLIGIDALAQPGTQPLTLTAYTNNGVTAVFTQSIRVLDGGYWIERVRIAAKLAALVDQTLNDEEAAEVLAIYRQFTPDRWWQGPFRLPVKGRLVSGYGNRRRYNGQDLGSYHSGLDISANAGTPVLAAAPGRVLAVREFKIRGNAVFIDHGHGVITGYFHMSKTNVKPGQMVNVGDPIGNVGSTGRSQGNHVHFDLAVSGVTVDPTPWLKDALP
jgi:murein DD-endopeptidase MepM/ murein hydrolase activator NlpD